MNLNKLLKELLGITGLPVEQDEYTENSKKYIIFVYEDEHPVAHGDNAVTADTVYIQVQLITPKKFDYFALKEEIRNLLEGAGFLVTSIRSFLGDASNGTEKTRQTIFHTEYTQGRRKNNG